MLTSPDFTFYRPQRWTPFFVYRFSLNWTSLLWVSKISFLSTLLSITYSWCVIQRGKCSAWNNSCFFPEISVSGLATLFSLIIFHSVRVSKIAIFCLMFMVGILSVFVRWLTVYLVLVILSPFWRVSEVKCLHLPTLGPLPKALQIVHVHTRFISLVGRSTGQRAGHFEYFYWEPASIYPFFIKRKAICTERATYGSGD